MAYFLQQLINGIALGSIYGLIAIGYTMVYGIIGMINFAHGDIFMVGAFIALIAFLALMSLGLTMIPLALLIVLIIAMLFTAVWGWTVERIAYRPLRESFRLAPLITAIGMSIVLQNVAYLVWGPKALPFPVPFGMPVEFGDMVLPQSYVWIVAAALVLMAALHLFLRKTRLGLAVRAVAHNKDIAYLMGINVPLMISVIFGIGCALGGAAGVLIGPINYVQVQMGIGVLIKAFAAAVVGGFGSLPGAVLGGLLVGVVESLGAGYVSGTYKDIYAFILLIIVLMVKPSGILGIEAKVKA